MNNIDNSTMEILLKIQDKFLFSTIKSITEKTKNIKSYVSDITCIPTRFIKVKLIYENKIYKMLIGFFVSEFEYNEFIIG